MEDVALVIDNIFCIDEDRDVRCNDLEEAQED